MNKTFPAELPMTRAGAVACAFLLIGIFAVLARSWAVGLADLLRAHRTGVIRAGLTGRRTIYRSIDKRGFRGQAQARTIWLAISGFTLLWWGALALAAGSGLIGVLNGSP